MNFVHTCGHLKIIIKLGKGLVGVETCSYCVKFSHTEDVRKGTITVGGARKLDSV